jgi:uncharacterized protein (TIGR00266 family)
MRYRITGDNLQIVTIELGPGEKVFAEAGSMVHMSGNMYMEAKARGGILKSLGRLFTGESFFLTEFTPQGGPGFVGFAGNAPGTIKAFEIAPGKEIICQKDAFLCATDGVELSVEFQRRLGAAFFGGEGLILQRLSGHGTAFIHACGDFVEFDLRPGQTIKVDTGSAVAWETTIDYDIQRAGGIKTMFFGGEGLFLTTLTGPGHVILQSMTLHNLARALQPFMAATQGTSGRRGVVGTLLQP